MLDILEEIVEYIMLALNIPNRPFLTALVKWLVLASILFTVMRIGRFFQSLGSAYILDDAKLCIALGLLGTVVSLFFDLIENKK